MDIITKICRVMIKEHGLTEHTLPTTWEHCNQIAKKELFASMIEKNNTTNLLDSLVLLANQLALLKEMDRLFVH
jgi:hypothetical protein